MTTAVSIGMFRLAQLEVVAARKGVSVNQLVSFFMEKRCIAPSSAPKVQCTPKRKCLRTNTKGLQ